MCRQGNLSHVILTIFYFLFLLSWVDDQDFSVWRKTWKKTSHSLNVKKQKQTNIKIMIKKYIKPCKKYLKKAWISGKENLIGTILEGQSSCCKPIILRNAVRSQMGVCWLVFNINYSNIVVWTNYNIQLSSTRRSISNYKDIYVYKTIRLHVQINETSKG